MAYDVPKDLAEKAAIMREFGRLRAAGEPVSAELYAKHVSATNDRYTTGPEPGQHIPDFALSDQNGVLRSLTNLAGRQIPTEQRRRKSRQAKHAAKKLWPETPDHHSETSIN